MRTIKVDDIAHVRFRAPELTEMRKFLDEFGLKTELSDDGIIVCPRIRICAFSPRNC